MKKYERIFYKVRQGRKLEFSLESMSVANNFSLSEFQRYSRGRYKKDTEEDMVN
jgi:hypothetical protein